MRHCTPTKRRVAGGSNPHGVSPVGLAAVAAVLHVAIYAGRVPARSLDHRQGTLLAWRMPGGGQVDPRRVADRVPSKPIQCFCAGQLSLTIGMAVVALAVWLHIMRISGAHGP